MNFLFDLPIELRLIALFVLGAVVGGQLNRGIYRLAWNHRWIGPWSSPLEGAPGRKWFDRFPIVGWLGLRRESALHGRGYWIRPLLIELFTGLGFATLYYWELSGHLVPQHANLATISSSMFHLQVFAHLVLIALMIVATFIDFDEKTIPDEITLPGTLVALLIAALIPAARLPVLVDSQIPGDLPMLDHLSLTTPYPWPAWLNGWAGLLYALACFIAWCMALMPAVWYLRGGWGRAIRLLLASMSVRRGSRRCWLLAIIGSGFIITIWTWGGIPWQSLLSSLVGMAFGGSLIWAVRIIGTRALGREAMGFGDVTLMAMIGAFLGWQPALLVFFLAPFAALAIATTQMLIFRRGDIAFGPYLCLGALVLVVAWEPIWNAYFGDVFILGWFIPLMVVVCLILMGVMLSVWKLWKDFLISRAERRRKSLSRKSQSRQRGGKKSHKGKKNR